MKRHCLIIAFLLAALLPLAGQHNPVRDNVYGEINYYNPSIVRSGNGIFASCYSRYEINRSPVYDEYPLDIAAEVEYIKGNNACFATIWHDGLSYYDASTLALGGMHKFSFQGKNDMHHLSIGGRVSLGLGRVDLEKLPYGYTGNKIMLHPDMDLGIEYTVRYFHLGISAKNLISMPIRYEGIAFFRYPRAYMFHVAFDVRPCRNDNWVMVPLLLMGMNQNFTMRIALANTIMKDYTLNYTFAIPDMSHNINVGFNIRSTVNIGLGYTHSNINKFSAVTVRLGVKLAKLD